VSAFGGKKSAIEIDPSIRREEMAIEIDPSIWGEEMAIEIDLSILAGRKRQ
jgi:hypothetical protein